MRLRRGGSGLYGLVERRRSIASASLNDVDIGLLWREYPCGLAVELPCWTRCAAALETDSDGAPADHYRSGPWNPQDPGPGHFQGQVRGLADPWIPRML